MKNDVNIVVFSKIETARNLYERFGGTIVHLAGFQRLLENYRYEIEQSRLVMKDLGLPEICSYCATYVLGGGCCGKEIASWYDPLTLLINLFFHVDFPVKSHYPDSCLFLAKDGCMLMARFHFCVNYLCARITEALTRQELTQLASQSGSELYSGWRLEVFLRQFFHSKGVSGISMG